MMNVRNLICSQIMEMEKVARPTKFSKKTSETIIYCRRRGMQFHIACSIAKVSKQTAYNWLELGRRGNTEFLDFLQAMQEAEHYRRTVSVPGFKKSEKESRTVLLQEFILASPEQQLELMTQLVDKITKPHLILASHMNLRALADKQFG